MKYNLLMILVSLISIDLSGQTNLEITVMNNSFEYDEGVKSPQKFPSSWGGPWTQKRKLNTPDLHTPEYIEFMVAEKASMGQNFLGLVSWRDSNNEGVSQVLKKPLLPDKEYQINFIAKSTKNYVSAGYLEEIDGEIKSIAGDLNYNNPVRILVIGRNKGREEILGKSEEISFDDWKNYAVEFMVNKEYQELVISLEPIHDEPIEKRNGNVLIDFISHIYSYE